jgi:fructose-bisphosphate aldolase class II
MIVTTAQLFKVAYGKFAIGAYNINNAEQTMGLFKGCMASKAPFIIQLSKGARKLHRQAHARSHHPQRGGDFPRGHLRRAPRSRRRKDLLRLHRQRLLQLGHDRRLARSARGKHRHHPARGGSRPRQGPQRRGGTRHAGRRGGRHQVDEGNACLTNPEEAVEFVPKAGATRSRRPSARATAPTNSRASSRSTSR